MTKMNYNSRTNRYINPTIDKHKQKVFLSLDSILPIGKYKGKKMVDVINQDLRYILWAKKEGVFLFEKDSLSLIREKRTESEKELNIVYKPREFAPYVKVEKNSNCKTVYVFDEKLNNIMTFDSVKLAAEYFKMGKSLLAYHIRNKNRIQDKYIVSYSQYILY
jgi:uncharacterized protein (DUF3820 family)